MAINSDIVCPSFRIRSSKSSNFSKLSAKSSFAKCLSRNAKRIFSPKSLLRSSIEIWSNTLSLMWVPSSSGSDKATAIPCLSLLRSVISFHASVSCLKRSLVFNLVNEEDLFWLSSYYFSCTSHFSSIQTS